MCELQSTIEFSVELYKFYNVDLFQRGMYQVRCSLRVASKLATEIEVTTPETTAGLGSASVLGTYGACRPFQILYRNEEITLKDVLFFRCHMLVDGSHLRESLEKSEFSLILELWFSDASPVSMVLVSSRLLQLNFSPIEGLHYHLPVLFDYFHLSAVSLTIHATLTALHQPSLKRGILRYVQSCAPKTTKSWTRGRPTQGSLLTDPVLPVTSNKIYSKISDFSQIQLEAYNVLIEASNNLKATIKEYRIILLQREEVITENYESIIGKHGKFNCRKSTKRSTPFNDSSTLAELCASNITLWNYFVLNFSCKTAIQQKLSKKHHSMRVRRFSEYFFLVYNPRRTAVGNFDTNYQKYLVIAELGRRSKYMQTLPSLPVQCTALDGDSSTMPIIFEDTYQDFTDSSHKLTYNIQLRTPVIRDFTVKTSKKLDDTSCSCGIGILLDRKKSSDKNPTASNFYSTSNTKISKVPAKTRHSKSLDHLQSDAKSTSHHSLSNLTLPITSIDSKMKYNTVGNNAHKAVGERNTRRFSNNRTNYKYNSTKSLTEAKNSCMCSLLTNHRGTSSQNAKIDKALLLRSSSNLEKSSYRNASVNRKDNRNVLSTTNISNNERYCKQLVKSLSQTSYISDQLLPRSNSMQLFSSKKAVGGNSKKFNSLANTQRQTEKLLTKKSVIDRDKDCRLRYTKYSKHKIKSKITAATSEKTPSSSFESLLDYRKSTGFYSDISDRLGKLKKSKSASNMDEEKTAIFPSHSESLPNVFPRLDNKLSYSNVKYYTSSSSDESGWISSRSSSSSNEVHVNMDHCAKPSFSDGLNGSGDTHSKPKKLTKRITKEMAKEVHTNGSSSASDIPSYKGCDTFNQGNIYDGIALLPPKQFRDIDSSSSSFTNGINDEELLDGVDNLLYHVINTPTRIETEPNSFNYSKSLETDEINFYRGTNIENENAFRKAKSEFKSQLNFPGILYSDLNLFASTVPYFHVSDEFRVFSPEGMHLIVCVHGLDGNSADLRLVKTYLELGLPGAYLDFLMSERNQGDTFSDFDTMTDRLVNEILNYLDSSSIRPTRVSFVGHSLGNIIIRSALTRPQMKFLLPKLHTFLSLSGPHLGTLYNSSGLVNMGMWFMQKWKKSGSLLQLCLKDTTDWRRSFLYTLSQRSTIHHFKNILLCGSGQDRYVPLHSARIELCKEALKDTSEQGTIFREMVHNILSPIISKKDVNLLRYDIHHALPNTANALIGRAAHIAVLDSELFIEKFMAVVGIKYFR